MNANAPLLRTLMLWCVMFADKCNRFEHKTHTKKPTGAQVFLQQQQQPQHFHHPTCRKFDPVFPANLTNSTNLPSFCRAVYIRVCVSFRVSLITLLRTHTIGQVTYVRTECVHMRMHVVYLVRSMTERRRRRRRSRRRRRCVSAGAVKTLFTSVRCAPRLYARAACEKTVCFGAGGLCEHRNPALARARCN